MCLGGLAAVCSQTRPGQASLLAAIDAHHEQAGHLIESGLRDAEAVFRDGFVGSAALHSELLWVGLLGTWMPLVPLSAEAVRHWAAAASAPQVVVSALTVGYALRKLLPRSAAEAHLSTSFHNALKRGRLHTLVTAAFSPVGLVHWLHAVLAVLAIAPDMAPEYGRKGLLGLYVAAGAAASLGSVLGGVLARRRSVARPSVSGAVMGMLLMRAALAPGSEVVVGSLRLPPLRAALLHLVVDTLSNAGGASVEKLFAMAGAAVMVASSRPQVRQLLQEGGWADGWEQMVEYVKGAI